MKPWGPLRNRIMVLFVGTVLVLSACVLTIAAVMRAGESRDGLRREAGLVIDALAAQAATRMAADEIEPLRRVAQGVAARSRVLGILFFDRNRALVVAEPPEVSRAAALRAWPGSEGASEAFLELRGLPAFARFQPVVAQTEVVGGVWLALDRQPQMAASRRFHTLALLIVVGLSGVALVLSTVFSEAVVKPLDELGETVAALERGELAARHEVKGPEELKRLARRFNRMAETLEASQASLSRLAADLDQQVRQRTRELEEQNRRFAQMANTDPLTGLTNRRGLEIELDRYLSLSRRNLQPLAVIMMDLDHFKTYNDKCGHLSGDTVLKAVAAALRGRARSSDVVARWGGDEFCILIPAADPQGALAATQRFVISVLEAMADLSRSDVSAALGASAGVACYPDDGEEAVELIARADAALYRVKASGGSGVQRASSTLSEE